MAERVSFSQNKDQRIERPPHGMPDLVPARSPGQD
jgi:hypothetical protein